MSINKSWMTKERVAEVLSLYRSQEAPTADFISQKLGTSIHTITWVLSHKMSSAEYEALKKLRYSRSKMGKKNPQFGKCGEDHPRWIGECKDGYGYLTCLVDGKRVFVHRHVMAKALGLKSLPRQFEVHHINDDREDNGLDNLALVTSAAHKAVHLLQRIEAKSLQLKKLSLWDAFRFTISP